jgi:tetratricopeptide (TPR) repeat protein
MFIKEKSMIKTFVLMTILCLIMISCVHNLTKEELYYNQGNKLYILEKYDEAINFYDFAFKIKPDYVNTWCNKGSALVNFGKNEEAILSFDKALELKPDLQEVWSNKGCALSNLGKYNEAIKCLANPINKSGSINSILH